MGAGERPVRLGFLASRNGSSMAAMLDAITAGTLRATGAIGISNNRGAAAFSYASAHNVPVAHVSRTRYGDEADVRMADLLAEHGAELIVLSGYMRKLGPVTLERFAGRILNIHPSLLPKFGGQGMYGRHVHEAVIAAGEQETGISVHLVTPEYDQGPVLAQTTVPVLAGDTADRLEARVRGLEPAFYVDVLRGIVDGEIKLPTE